MAQQGLYLLRTHMLHRVTRVTRRPFTSLRAKRASDLAFMLLPCLRWLRVYDVQAFLLVRCTHWLACCGLAWRLVCDSFAMLHPSLSGSIESNALLQQHQIECTFTNGVVLAGRHLGRYLCGMHGRPSGDVLRQSGRAALGLWPLRCVVLLSQTSCQLLQLGAHRLHD